MNKQTNWTGIPGSQYPVLMDLEPTSKMCKSQRIYWDQKNGRYYHKDALHSEVEVYDRRGNHIGVMNPDGTWHARKGQDKRKTLRGII